MSACFLLPFLPEFRFPPTAHKAALVPILAVGHFECVFADAEQQHLPEPDVYKTMASAACDSASFQTGLAECREAVVVFAVLLAVVVDVVTGIVCVLSDAVRFFLTRAVYIF